MHDLEFHFLTYVTGLILMSSTAAGAVTIVNYASNSSGPIAPGELVALKGVGPSCAGSSACSVAGWAVTFDGTPARLYNSPANEIGLVVPLTVASTTTTEIQITNAGNLVATLYWPVAPAAPGIFALFNGDMTPNSIYNPAVPGGSIVLFATGLGTNTALTVRIGASETSLLLRAPLSPSSNGVEMVTAKIPDTVAVGSTVPVVIAVGSARSQSGVTVAITSRSTQPTTHSVQLMWNPSISPDILGYTVYRGETSGGPYTPLNSTLITDTTYNDTAIQSGNTYYYVVTATDANNASSDYSNEAAAQIP